MAKKYYKVVEHRRYYNVRVSAVIDGPMLCTYGTAQWTRGISGTPVMAFSTLESAEAFKQGNAGNEVWEAKVQRPRHINRLMRWYTGSQHMRRFWGYIAAAEWDRVPKTNARELAPRDTVACEAIKLVKKVG